MKQKKTLWIVSELFPPEETSTGYIMGEIANTMVDEYEVRVICGPEQYDKNKKISTDSVGSIDPSIKIIRVDPVVENKKSKLSRIRKFLLMSWRLYAVARKNIKKGDKVLMVTNPFPLIVLMGHLRRHRDFTLSMLVHDIAPEGLYTDIHIPSFVYPMVEKMFNKAYSSTDLLISIGRDMSEVLACKCGKYAHKPSIEIIENWGDVVGIYPRPRPISDKIIIQYAGNIGNAQGVGEFVNTLHESNCSNIEFSIWGTGSAESAIKEQVYQLGLEDRVVFNGPYMRSQQSEILNKCDIALVRLVKGMYGLGVPSKTYNILAAGKPILYIGERGTEIWRVVEENGNGFCFEPSDTEGLCAFLHSLSMNFLPKLQEMGAISRRLAENNYSKDIILNKFANILAKEPIRQ